MAARQKMIFFVGMFVFFVVASCEVGVLSVSSFEVPLKQKPEVIDTAERLLRVDHVEVDDGVHTHRHRVPRQDLVPENLSEVPI